MFGDFRSLKPNPDEHRIQPIEVSRLALGAAAGIRALAAAVIPHWETGTMYGTGIGEQQLVILDDGTRLTLNTPTCVE